MNWATLLVAVQGMDPVEAILVTVITIYFFYKGGSNYFLPFIRNKSKKKSKEDSLIGIHENCKNFSSVALILEKVMDKSDRIFRIKYQETLYDQMNDAEIVWDSTRDALMENFLLVLHNSPDLIISKSQISDAVYFYGKIIDAMEVDILGVVRRWMRKNHFAEKSHIEYDRYIEEKTRLLEDKISRLFDESYHEDRLLVERPLVQQSFNKNYKEQLHRNIRIFLIKAKTTAVVNLKRIKDIEEEISKI